VAGISTMSIVGDILGGSIGSIVEKVGGVIDNLSTSGEEKLEARRKLMEIELEYRKALITAERDIVQAQADVIKTEAGSSNWLAANWRPILMLVFTIIIAHNYMVAPLFSLKYMAIPEPMWELLKIGVGGYVFMRSGEKIARDVVKHRSGRKARGQAE
jgi:hypothetical protein